MGEYLFNSASIIEGYEGCTRDRARWFAYIARHTPKEIFDEAAPKAIYEFGYDKGMKTPGARGSVRSFADVIVNGYAALNCGNHIVSITDEKVVIHGTNCPLVNAWKEMGCTQEEIAHYCKLISAGDHGHADAVGINFEWGATIANGDPYCEMLITKKD